MKRLVIGMSGATGAPLTVKLLQLLQDCEVETHLIVSPWAKITLQTETSYTYEQLIALTHHHYSAKNLGAVLSSGSVKTDGMVVVPCSMRTLGAIRTGISDNLLTRAADVTLKERRPLVLVVRETPLSTLHLENMYRLSQMGVTIFPLMPAFYNCPQTIEDLLTHLALRILDQFQISHPASKPWQGIGE